MHVHNCIPLYRLLFCVPYITPCAVLITVKNYSYPAVHLFVPCLISLLHLSLSCFPSLYLFSYLIAFNFHTFPNFPYLSFTLTLRCVLSPSYLQFTFHLSTCLLYMLVCFPSSPIALFGHTMVAKDSIAPSNPLLPDPSPHFTSYHIYSLRCP